MYPILTFPGLDSWACNDCQLKQIFNNADFSSDIALIFNPLTPMSDQYNPDSTISQTQNSPY